MPSVEPAFDLADLLELSDANVRPALERAFFEGFAMGLTSSRGTCP